MADNQTEKQKVQELTDKLERGLTELFNSDSYKNYLSTMSKIHNYSFNNTFLIAMQKPEASLVAGYKAWQKNFDRHVNKGEKAIRILAPAPYKIKQERDNFDREARRIAVQENMSESQTLKTMIHEVAHSMLHANIVDVVVAGSRCRGMEQENSDLDVVVEYTGSTREDDLRKPFRFIKPLIRPG